jgi:hypothetical protein
MAMNFEQPLLQRESQENLDSRFGNRAEILRELDENPVSVLGPIRDHLPEIREHTNQVELATIEESNLSSSDASLAKIDDEYGGFYAVFKPFNGENQEVKDGVKIGSFFTREVLSSRIAEDVLKLDVTPPISIRIVNDQIGSLQFFLDHARYAPMSAIMESGDLAKSLELIESSDDYMRIALLDFVLLGADRNDDNMLVKVQRDEHRPPKATVDGPGPAVAAIDNAITLSINAYNRDPRIVGPSFTMTGEYGARDKVIAKEIAIPDHLLDHISDGIRRWDNVIAECGLLIEEDERHKKGEAPSLPLELEWARQRMEALLEQRVFLSRVNTRRLPENILRNADHPHPNFKPYQVANTHPFLHPLRNK